LIRILLTQRDMDAGPTAMVNFFATLIASFREFKLSSEVCSKPAMLSGIIRDDELGAATILRRRFCIRFDIEYDDP
jgi:hypothetical protein